MMLTDLKVITNDKVEIYFQNKKCLLHTEKNPFLYVGIGKETVKMQHGNFDISDYVIERIALRSFKLLENNTIRFFNERYEVICNFAVVDARLVIDFKSCSEELNRFWIRLPAEKDEHLYGCGEQFTHFDLKGRHFPLWTSEQGVGRNKKTYTTWQADIMDNAGGDYFWTFYPQPTFVSSKNYFIHAYCDAWMDFDFRTDDFHELQFWSLPRSIVYSVKNDIVSTVSDVSALLGRQCELPDWVHDGIILGIQGGTDICANKVDVMKKSGAKVAGIWAQDWEGIKMTSFGKRLHWNWVWNEALYPSLPEKIKEWNKEGVHFMAYINPYVLKGESLCNEALSQDFLAKTKDGDTYFVDFGEYDCAIIDLTNPKAFGWYKSVIKKNMIDLGISGWMADFGEYLPTDCVLYDGVNAMLTHNRFPGLWARANKEIVEECQKEKDVTFFMRAGNYESPRYSALMWAGDQNVDWSEDDGLPSVITAALSSAMSGHGLHHSDTGGYTTLFDMKRTAELLLRWTELNTFTCMLRTHEGNRPSTNIQFDSNQEVIDGVSRMSRVFEALKEYRKYCVKENAEKGLSVMRPLFMHYPDEEKTWTIKDQFLFGQDVLVAPVITEGATSREVYLPKNRWIHLWTGKECGNNASSSVIVEEAPLGFPPVYYKADSLWATSLFEKIKNV